MPDDYGNFGKGTTGYVHYMQAFNRNLGKDGGRKRTLKGGCITQIIGVTVVMVIVLAILFLIIKRFRCIYNAIIRRKLCYGKT